MDRDKTPDSDVRFDHAPYFNFNDGKVKFDTNWLDNANDNYGSASGFVPKSLLTKKGVPGTPFSIKNRLSVSSRPAYDLSRLSSLGVSRISLYR